MPKSERFDALDGLRGVAALVVVLHHGFLTSSAVADAFRSESGEAPRWAQIITYTPLHLVWAGSEAVLVFFVLSGFILTYQRLRPKPEPWRAYYPKRIVRLYVPVVGAVLVSIAIVAMVGRDTSTHSWWVNAHETPSLPQFLQDSFLLAGISDVNTALWSLEWEVWFSLLLPAFILGAIATQRRGGLWIGLLLVFAARAVGSLISSPVLLFLPIFAVGALIAVHREYIGELFGRYINSGIRTAVVATVACIALIASWPMRLIPISDAIESAAKSGGILLGAGLLVVLALYSPGVRHLLCVRPIRWLGSRSFSLYLIHEPIIVSAANILPESDNPILVTFAGLVVALAISEAFFRIVEQPSMDLSRRIGQAIRRRSEQRAASGPHHLRQDDGKLIDRQPQ